MTRSEKIKLLTSIYSGRVSIKEILPEKINILCTGPGDDDFFINGERVSEDVYNKFKKNKNIVEMV